MPKTTTAGPTNAWEPPPPVTCAECGAQVAAGAPRCPECPSTEFTRPEVTEHPADGTWSPEVSNDAVPGAPVPEQVTQLPAPEEMPIGELLAHVLTEPQPETVPAVKDAQAPDAVPEPAPAVPPRTPPRRAVAPPQD